MAQFWAPQLGKAQNDTVFNDITKSNKDVWTRRFMRTEDEIGGVLFKGLLKNCDEYSQRDKDAAAGLRRARYRPLKSQAVIES